MKPSANSMVIVLVCSWGVRTLFFPAIGRSSRGRGQSLRGLLRTEHPSKSWHAIRTPPALAMPGAGVTLPGDWRRSGRRVRRVGFQDLDDLRLPEVLGPADRI